MNEELKKYIIDNKLTYHIETYGCQMNVHESEKIAGVLESIGYKATAEKNTASLIVFNTCCVREHAEARLSGNLGALKSHKEIVPGALIAVGGCMTQQDGTAEKLKKRFPFLDIVFGTNHTHLLGGMIEKALLHGRRIIEAAPEEEIIEGLPVKTNGASSAFVNIIYGCNNFCSYCVVPFVRGRERSRKPDDILREIDSLCTKGVKEITLLGQNVNSYNGGIPFPKLLERIDKETDIKRLRFMTSHPKDLTDELIECFGKLPSLCEHIHLPVQSGSDRILSLMNRRYTKNHYLSLVEKLRTRIPDIALTTDIIVGFPGETEEDFEYTLDLVREVKFDAAYTFAYSKRSQTKAAKMEGHLDRKTKSERLLRLNALINDCMIDKNAGYLGKNVEILVDGVSLRNPGELSGRTRSAKTVIIEGSSDFTGKRINVNIDGVKTHTLHGIIAGDIK